MTNLPPPRADELRQAHVLTRCITCDVVAQGHYAMVNPEGGWQAELCRRFAVDPAGVIDDDYLHTRPGPDGVLVLHWHEVGGVDPQRPGGVLVVHCQQVMPVRG